MKQILIIGGGPAGISAALYTARAGIETSIIACGSGALEKAERIDNYFGFGDTVSGRELLEGGKKQAERLGVTFINDEIVNLTYTEDDDFEAVGIHRRYRGDAVILASGASRQKISVRGLDAFEGRGVSYCAVCDAFFYRGCSVAVIGSGSYALHEAEVLLPVAKSVTVLSCGQPEIDFPSPIRVVTAQPEEVYGTQTVEGVRLAGGERIACEGVFVALGTAGASDLARKLGAVTEKGNIVIDGMQRTSIAGVYAAGDCTGGILQVSVAVGEGAKAALAAISFLRSKEKPVKKS